MLALPPNHEHPIFRRIRQSTRCPSKHRPAPEQDPGAPALKQLAAGALIAFAIASAGTSVARAGSWQLDQPAPPAGAAFKVPLGTPDDMEFYAPNEGLLSVQGNAVVAPGLFFWNGRNWHQLSTVCGGSGEASRIAWAGPDEFWVITEPSEPRSGAGLGLCHFQGRRRRRLLLHRLSVARPLQADGCRRL